MITFLKKSSVLSLLILSFGLHAVLANPTHQATVTVVKSPTHRVVLTSTETGAGAEAKADVLRRLIEASPENSVFHLVFKPTLHNAEIYRKILAILEPTIKQVLTTKNVKVETQLVNDDIAQMSYQAFADIHSMPVEDVYLNFEADGYLMIEEAPRNLVERPAVVKPLVEKMRDRSSVWANLMGSFRNVGRTMKNGVREGSFTGIAVASTLVIGMDASTIIPSSVYISDGELTMSSIFSMAMATSLLYATPRHEELTYSLHQLGYQLVRSVKDSVRFLFNRPWFSVNKWKFIISEPSERAFNISKAVMGVGLYSFAVQSTFFYLQDGTAIWNPEYFSYMVRNSVLIGAASAPWSFATRKLKRETNISKEALAYLRTAQLLWIGHLAVSIPYGSEAAVYQINPDEVALVGLGGLGLLTNKFGVRIANKLDGRPWWEFTQRNLQAILKSPDTMAINIARKLRGKKAMLSYGFVSSSQINQALNYIQPTNNQCSMYLTGH